MTQHGLLPRSLLPISRVNLALGSCAANRFRSGCGQTDGRNQVRFPGKFCGTNRPATALSWQPAAHFPLPVLGRCRGRSRRKASATPVFLSRALGGGRGYVSTVLLARYFG